MKSQIKAKSLKKASSVALAHKPAALGRVRSTGEAAPMAPAHKNRPTGPGKTFHKDGHWIENPRKNVVLVCECGNRYLKTRSGQDKCLRCLSQGK